MPDILIQTVEFEESHVLRNEAVGPYCKRLTPAVPQLNIKPLFMTLINLFYELGSW